MLEWTGERFVPWMAGAQIHYEHLHRYAFAQQFVAGKDVIDLACGEGYGTAMLADEATILHATTKYSKENLKYMQGSIIEVPLKGKGLFDVAICFETIEHITEHDKLLSEVKRLLKDDGLFIVSTPNKAVYTDAPDYHNPFHVKEIYYNEFIALLKKYFKNIRVYGQRVFTGSNIWSVERHEKITYQEWLLSKDEKEFQFADKKCKEPMYYIALASDISLQGADYINNGWMLDTSDLLIKSYETQVNDLSAIVQAKDTQISAIVQARDNQIGELSAEIQARDALIHQIMSGIVMRLMTKFKKIVEKILPPGSRLNRFYNKALTGLHIIVNEGWHSFWVEITKSIGINKKQFSDASKQDGLIRGKSSGNDMFIIMAGTMTEDPQAKAAIFLSNPENKLTFPHYDNPYVSIIILTYNKVDYTYQCLKSILMHTDTPYQIIIIDNGSSDETTGFLDRLENALVFRNATNVGFVEGCNYGASKASSPYLMFLNNDTMVTDGWLSQLVDVMEKDNCIGAAGSKIVWFDGRLQEAGSIVWSDGTTRGYGRGDYPDKPEYSYIRQVDYCSACCLLVRTKLFKEAGCFDGIYSPAYYEDADLCLAIQNLGYKVIYQPLSIVFHHEFKTSSFALAQTLMEKNRLKFGTKWHDLLSKQPANSTDNVLSARDKRDTKSILVMDDIIPATHKGVGYPRAYQLLKNIAELGYKVTFFPLLSQEQFQPYTHDFQQMGVEIIYGQNMDFTEFARSRSGFYDLVIASRPYNMRNTIEIVKRFFNNAVIIYDAEAFFPARDILKAKIEGRPLDAAAIRKIIDDETALMRKADMIITVSEFEKEQILKEAEVPNIEIWGHPDKIHNSQFAFQQRKDLLFVGSFVAGRGSPNEDAAVYFSKKLLPSIREKLSCNLYIVGSDPTPAVTRLNSSHVIVTGYVEDVADYYDKCRVFVVPTRFAAGISLKLLEAMGYGIPAIVTPLIADELGLHDRVEVLIARDNAEFVLKTIELYTDMNLWQKIQSNAFRYIKDHCDPDKLRSELKQILIKGLQIRNSKT
jgi:GT2 family glycosyltransferase/ubiquinone/menaquinone biosynthesis C-methylase UbiE